jgi:hypothetical protein
VITAAGFGALVAMLYVVSVHVVVGDSDGATVILEGQSMSTGNLLLHHWALSFDSFWSVDAIFYTFAVLIAGVRLLLVHLVPAVIAALVVVTGSLIARMGHRGISALAGMATVFALLGLPSYVLADFLLRGPLHVGTVLWCLLAFVCLAHRRPGWRWIVAVALFAAGALGDFQMVALGMVPALVCGGVAMVRTRTWRGGLATATAPVAALALYGAVRITANAFGTFSIAGANPTAPLSRVPDNLDLLGTWGAHMLGLGGGDLGTGGVPGPLEAVHVLGVVAVLTGVVLGAMGLVRGVTAGNRAPATDGTWRIDDLLVMAFVADIAVFVIFTISSDQDFSRYLTGAVVFGAVLAGRTVCQIVEITGPSWVRRGCAVVGVAVVAAFGAGVAFTVGGAAPDPPYVQLGAFLEAHHLERGIGDYWSSSITTVATRDLVAVRPVIAGPSGRLVRYDRQSETDWYAGQTFQFLVYDTAHLWGDVDASSASITFGPVAQIYSVGTYRVLVWRHAISVPDPSP